LSIMRKKPTVSLQPLLITKPADVSSNPEAPPPYSNDDDEQYTRLWICNREPQTLAKTCLGGLRRDPFDTFPIPNRGHVPSAFDYC
jgi:hypothetical protein